MGPVATNDARRGPVAALLLTGGSSRRMGRDKATLVIDGEPLAERTARLLRAVANPVIEVGPGYTDLPTTREQPPGSGPLSALAAGAKSLHPARDTLVVATDLPRLTAAYLQRLIEHPAASGEHSVVPRDGEGRAQPLCARYSPAALAQAVLLRSAGERSMTALLERIPITWFDAVAEDDSAALIDVDTPEDLAAATKDTVRS
jgi:molybdopterin-guanine dinucleotide biosynthesis protein A